MQEAQDSKNGAGSLASRFEDRIRTGSDVGIDSEIVQNLAEEPCSLAALVVTHAAFDPAQPWKRCYCSRHVQDRAVGMGEAFQRLNSRGCGDDCGVCHCC